MPLSVEIAAELGRGRAIAFLGWHRAKLHAYGARLMAQSASSGPASTRSTHAAESWSHGELGGAQRQLGLEHEGQRVFEILRFQLGIGGALEGLSVRAVAGHAVVQAGPAGQKPSAFASYAPNTRPMNSFIRLRWNQGGRKVCSATSQRGGKMAKSQLAVPGTVDGEFSTQ